MLLTASLESRLGRRAAECVVVVWVWCWVMVVSNMTGVDRYRKQRDCESFWVKIPPARFLRQTAAAEACVVITVGHVTIQVSVHGGSVAERSTATRAVRQVSEALAE